MYQHTRDFTAAEKTKMATTTTSSNYAAEVREAQINQTLCRLQGLSESLSREFSSLLGRIDPILMPAVETNTNLNPGPVAAPKKLMAPLAVQLDDLSDELEMLLSRIGSTVSRIEC